MAELQHASFIELPKKEALFYLSVILYFIIASRSSIIALRGFIISFSVKQKVFSAILINFLSVLKVKTVIY
jgi:hypothetical protein